MAAPQIDAAQLRALQAEGLSQNEIAKRLGAPRSTVRDRLKTLEPSTSLDTTTVVSTEPATSLDTTAVMSTEGIPNVYKDMIVTMMNDLQEIVVWWQERKATLHQANDASRETERTTFHVERRWVDAIRRQADLDHLTITHVVNEAFRQLFEGKQTQGTP
jgi:predicted ArsR family transcriptional regulator